MTAGLTVSFACWGRGTFWPGGTVAAKIWRCWNCFGTTPWNCGFECAFSQLRWWKKRPWLLLWNYFWPDYVPSLVCSISPQAGLPAWWSGWSRDEHHQEEWQIKLKLCYCCTQRSGKCACSGAGKCASRTQRWTGAHRKEHHVHRPGVPSCLCWGAAGTLVLFLKQLGLLSALCCPWSFELQKYFWGNLIFSAVISQIHVRKGMAVFARQW